MGQKLPLHKTPPLFWVHGYPNLAQFAPHPPVPPALVERQQRPARQRAFAVVSNDFRALGKHLVVVVLPAPCLAPPSCDHQFEPAESQEPESKRLVG